MQRYHNNRTCIEACLRAAAMSNYCASRCTLEEDVNLMSACIRLNMECAAICYATGQLLSLGSDSALELCRICAEICEACADECELHDHNEHCRVSAKTCRFCAEICREITVAA